MEFLNRTLSWLDSVYDFKGSRVRTNDVDLASVQLVHDVGENAALSLVTGDVKPYGIYTISEEFQTAAGFKFHQFTDPLGELETAVGQSIDAPNLSFWMIDIRAYVVANATSPPTNLGAVLWKSPRGENAVGSWQLHRWWEDVYTTSTTPSYRLGLSRDGTIGPNIPTPMLLKAEAPGGTFGAFADKFVLFTNAPTSASPNVGLAADILILPKGVVPPTGIHF